MYKLTVYLIETDFKEWWIMIIWSLVVPATTSIAILKIKDKKIIEKEKIKMKSIDIKGKQYVPVNERIKVFRNEEKI